MVKNSKSKALSNEQTKVWTPSKRLKKKDSKPQLEDHLEQIPFQLRRIMKSREEMNMGSSKRKKIMRAFKAKAQTEIREQEDIKVPKFQRGKKESEADYLRRMSQDMQHVVFLTKNQPERRPEQMLEEKEEKSTTSNKDVKKKKRWLHKKKVKQQKNAEKTILAGLKDKVEFGEVAMEPPSLTVKPKKAPVKSQRASSSLLLSSILGHSDVSTAKPSMARQRIIEEEHERVVHAYRQMKKMNRAKSSKRNEYFLNPQ